MTTGKVVGLAKRTEKKRFLRGFERERGGEKGCVMKRKKNGSFSKL